MLTHIIDSLTACRRVFVMLICSMTSLWADATFKETVVSFIKANVSQKISAQDFNIILENWTDAWEKENTIDATLTANELSLQNDQRRFTIHVNGLKGGSKKLMGKIEWLTEVPTLNRPIGPDEIIQESDIVMQKVDADRLTATQIKNIPDLIGKTAKNAMLKAGAPLNKSEIQSPLVIKKGNIVTITYKKGNLRISTQGVAEKDGYADEMIPFETQNGSSEKRLKKIIHAKVVSSNSAVMGDPDAV
jgi:flagellar basal body P-ring formation protein FlgA